MATVISVNRALARALPLGRGGRSGIDKRPVAGAVEVIADGLVGDEAGQPAFHGGLDKAVYAFGREDLDRWAQMLGKEIPDGRFGENLTTRGIDVNLALIGERWRIGSTLLEVSSVRIPCRRFAAWLNHHDYDTGSWVRRFTADQRPGPYLRVLEAGTITAGDRIDVVHRPEHDITVSALFRALTGDRSLLPAVLCLERLADDMRDRAERQIAADVTCVTLPPPVH